MRAIVISDRSRLILEGAIAGCAFKLERQLADKSWEATVDDDLAFALDVLSGDPDKAINLILIDNEEAHEFARV